MGNTLGLPTDIPNHANYIADWLGKLRDDKREIFRAAAAAQRIADYCLGFHPDYGAMSDEAQEPEQAAEEAQKLAA